MPLKRGDCTAMQLGVQRAKHDWVLPSYLQ